MSQKEKDRTPLHEAASSGNIRKCRWLIFLGANLNAEDAYGRTPPIEAIEQHHLEVCQFLIDKGAYKL